MRNIMKLIIAFFVFTHIIGFAAPANDVQRCVQVLFHQFAIPKNSFVKPSGRYYFSQTSWYHSVNWTAVPRGPVMWNTPRSGVIEIFDTDYKTTAGSIANLMRYALGIPKFSDITLGEKVTDPELFKRNPCLYIYTDYEWHKGTGYDIDVTVTSRQKNEVLLRGYLTVEEV